MLFRLPIRRVTAGKLYGDRDRRAIASGHVRPRPRLRPAALDAARSAGYEAMRLDTLARLTEVIALYESEGFYAVEPYYENPLDGVVYLECLL